MKDSTEALATSCLLEEPCLFAVVPGRGSKVTPDFEFYIFPFWTLPARFLFEAEEFKYTTRCLGIVFELIESTFMSVKMASWSALFSLTPSSPVNVIDFMVAFAVLPDEIRRALAALSMGPFLAPGPFPVRSVTPS